MTSRTPGLVIGESIQSNKARNTRMVFSGEFQKQPAIIKAYTGGPKAWLHWKICRFHGRVLRRRNIPAPDIWWSGWDGEIGAYLIVYEHLPNPTDFEWLRKTPSFQQRLAGYQKLLKLFAFMHSRGIEQSDTTPGNFLESGGEIYAIDEDRMNVRRKALGRRRSLRNVASMATQYPQLLDDEITELYDFYRRERNWNHQLPDVHYLREQMAAFREWRQDKKGFRRRKTRRWLLAGTGVIVAALALTLLL